MVVSKKRAKMTEAKRVSLRNRNRNRKGENQIR